jgi:hypothetical protein
MKLSRVGRESDHCRLGGSEGNNICYLAFALVAECRYVFRICNFEQESEA